MSSNRKMHLGVHICCDKADFDDTRSQCSRTPEYTGACNLRPIVRSIEAFSGSHTVDHTTLWFAHYRTSSSCMAKQPPGPPEVAGGQRSSANALLTACDPPKERGLRIPMFGRLTLDRRLVRSSGKPHDVGQPHPGLRGNVSLRSGDPLSGVLMWEAGPLSIRRLFMCVRPVRIDVLPVQPGAGADFRCSGACDHVLTSNRAAKHSHSHQHFTRLQSSLTTWAVCGLSISSGIPPVQAGNLYVRLFEGFSSQEGLSSAGGSSLLTYAQVWNAECTAVARENFVSESGSQPLTPMWVLYHVLYCTFCRSGWGSSTFPSRFLELAKITPPVTPIEPSPKQIL